MNLTPFPFSTFGLWKFAGLALVALCLFVPMGQGAAGLVVPLGFLALLAGLEAAQREGVKMKSELTEPSGLVEVPPMRVIRGMAAPAVGGFYVLLVGLLVAGHLAANPMSERLASKAVAKTGATCGSGGGCSAGHGAGCGSGGCGKSAGGACGCSSKKSAPATATVARAPAAKASPPRLTDAQMKARLEALKKRNLTLQGNNPAAPPPRLPLSKAAPKPALPSIASAPPVASPPSVQSAPASATPSASAAPPPAGTPGSQP